MSDGVSLVEQFQSEFLDVARDIGAVPRDTTEDTQGGIAEDTVEGITQDEPVNEEVTEEVTEEVQVEPEDPELASLLAKYGGDTNAALKASLDAQRKIAEQGSELGELRKLNEQMVELQRQLVEQQKPQVQQPQYDPSSLNDWLDENVNALPAIAANAYQNGDQALYQAALAKWGELAPWDAAAFNANVVVEAKTREIEARLSQSLAPVQQELSQREYAAAVNNVIATYPEMQDPRFANDMMQQIAQQPWLSQAIQNGDLAQKQNALAAAVLMTRGARSAGLQQANSEIRGQQAATTRQAKAEASVLSADTNANVSSGTSPDPIKGFKESLMNSDAWRRHT